MSDGNLVPILNFAVLGAIVGLLGWISYTLYKIKEKLQ